MPRAFSFTDIDRGWHLDAYKSSLSGSGAVLDGKHYDIYSGYQCGVNLLGSAEALRCGLVVSIVFSSGRVPMKQLLKTSLILEDYGKFTPV